MPGHRSASLEPLCNHATKSIFQTQLRAQAQSERSGPAAVAMVAAAAVPPVGHETCIALGGDEPPEGPKGGGGLLTFLGAGGAL
ncbi:hypothetical protein JCM24511_05494 [Saitozyma sp. JCM 24511]|nr:hypothetical protein JCM24511_05494 [Saitozyma sp. JCM 24511]